MDDLKKICLFSNYSWAYLSTAIAKKYFPPEGITLVTMNIDDVAKKHDFGVRVIESRASGLKKLFKLRKESFDAVVMDHGFNLDIALLVLGLRVRKIFIIDLNRQAALRDIGKSGFVKIFLKKLPYFINKLLLHLSRTLRLSSSLGMPTELSLETTTICNLRCKGCPTGLEQLNRAPVHISKELFERVVSKNSINFKYLDVIYPFIFGEPLLNAEIFGYLKKLRSISPPYTRIELHTNGNIKNPEEAAQRLLETGIDLVNISLDGTSKQAYESFRKNGNFELVCDFMNNLTSLKKKMGISNPEIVAQMIVTKYSENQVEAFKELKDRLGADRLTYKEYFYEFTELSDEEGASLAPSKKEHLLGKDDKKRIIEGKKNLCGWAYRSISIMNNGNVTPCCIDFNTTLLDGLNINDLTIKEIWNSKKYRRFRRDMLDGKIPLCNKCFFS